MANPFMPDNGEPCAPSLGGTGECGNGGSGGPVKAPINMPQEASNCGSCGGTTSGGGGGGGGSCCCPGGGTGPGGPNPGSPGPGGPLVPILYAATGAPGAMSSMIPPPMIGNPIVGGGGTGGDGGCAPNQNSCRINRRIDRSNQRLLPIAAMPQRRGANVERVESVVEWTRHAR
jgi:hypothetical protein